VAGLERLIAILCAGLVFLVFAGVAGLTVFFPGGSSSGIPDVALRSEHDLADWLRKQRGHDLQVPERGDPPALPRRHTSAGQSRNPPAVSTTPAGPSLAEDTVPLAQRVFPEVSWLRRQPGVRYPRPRRIPRWLKRKHQSLQDARAAAQGGGGRFVEGPRGETRYQLTWLDPQSDLARIGLRAQDRIVAVNGLPIARSVAGGQRLYERLRGADRFTILIERGGERVLLSYEVR